MQKLELEVQVRDMNQTENKKNPNQYRREGLIPAVVYGHGEPVPVLVDAKIFGKAIQTKAGANAIFNVKMGSKTEMSIIKEIQRDIFTRHPIHVDFQRINASEKIEVTIPIHIIGESNGVKNQGGILEFVQREIRIKCLPADLIGSIDVDVSNLDIHQSVKVSNLAVPNGVEITTGADHIVVNIVAPKAEEEKPAATAVEGAAAQPEVIAKGKKEEEGAAAAGTAAAPAAGAATAAPAAKGDKKK